MSSSILFQNPCDLNSSLSKQQTC
uniref:Uncharacterized protein n=1 Tax=Arundo donax TaxID=35708 RepID=A0A0A9HBM3_ARUDO